MDADWQGWERAIAEKGITFDRPQFSRHPDYPEIVYPLNYGFVNETPGEDGQELDIFVGSAPSGLVAYERTVDHMKGDTEIKLLYNCTPQEVYLVHGFLNYAPELLSGKLVMRMPMAELWERMGFGESGGLRKSQESVDNPPQSR
ncbi:Inorganic pyrophosphatase [compost metagenome]